MHGRLDAFLRSGRLGPQRLSLRSRRGIQNGTRICIKIDIYMCLYMYK